MHPTPRHTLRRLHCLLPFALATAALAQTTPPAEPVLRLADLVVTPSRFRLSNEGDGSASTLTRDELQARPQVGEDLFRSISHLPGVTADDYTAKFWVRGAPQRQLLVRLDGADLLEPFHLKDVDGALSIIDLRAIRRLDLMTGGFNADYGNRAAAVLTMETVTPSGPRNTYSAGLSVTGMRAGAAGTFAGGDGCWFASVRRGYPDLALRLEDREEKIYPRYWDAYTKVEFALSPAQVLSFHALHAADELRVDDNNAPDLRSGYDSDTLWFRLQSTWSPRLSSETVLAQSWLAWRRDGAGIYGTRDRLDLRDRRSLASTDLRQDWQWRGESVLFRTGWTAAVADARYSYHLLREESTVINGVLQVVPRSFTLSPSPSGDSTGAFAALRFAAGPALALEPGVRFDRHDAAGDSDVTPRLNAAWELADHTTLRAAWGRYAQAQGWHELAVQFGDTTFYPSEKAEHRVLSLEHRLKSGLSLRAEAYERVTTDPRPHWFSRFDAYNLFPEAQGDRILLQPSDATARGLEFIVQRRGRGAFDWSASYALARATEQVGAATIPVARDQRHTFSLDTTYRIGPWSFGAAWQYHTGWPTTDVFHTLLPLNNGGRAIVRSYGPTLGARLPAYHRLDLRASRTFKLRAGEITVFLDIFNAYDHANPIAYDYDTSVAAGVLKVVKRPRNMLPILPTAGITWER